MDGILRLLQMNYTLGVYIFQPGQESTKYSPIPTSKSSQNLNYFHVEARMSLSPEQGETFLHSQPLKHVMCASAVPSRSRPKGCTYDVPA